MGLQVGSMTYAFVDACTAIQYYGLDVAGTKEVLNYNVTVMDPRDRFVATKQRKTVRRYTIAEFLWYMRGSNCLEEIAHYAPFWRTVSDDGETVNSAYGDRLLYRFGVNQWDEAYTALCRNRDTRQAVMYIASPTDVGRPTKDFPCTYGLQFMIRKGELHLTVLMRSNDLIRGFCNDAPVFTMMQEYMLQELRCNMQTDYRDLKLGVYTHFAVSMHRYDKHAEKVRRVAVLPDQVLGVDEYQTQMPAMTERTLQEMHMLQQNERLLRMADTSEEIQREPHVLTDAWCIAAYDLLKGEK